MIPNSANLDGTSQLGKPSYDQRLALAPRLFAVGQYYKITQVGVFRFVKRLEIVLITHCHNDRFRLRPVAEKVLEGAQTALCVKAAI